MSTPASFVEDAAPASFVPDPPEQLPDPKQVVQIADANAKMLADALTRPAPLPKLPPMLDTTTPNPHNIFQRALIDKPLNDAASIAGGASRAVNGANPDAVAGGVNDVIRGGLGLATPLIGSGAVAAPVGTLLTLGAADLASKGTEAGLSKLGASPEMSELGGNVAGLAAGVKVGKGAFDRFMEARLDKANTRAAEGVGQERMRGTESAQDVLGGDSIPVNIDGKPFEIQPSGQSSKGRPYFTVVDKSTGKPVYGGYGDAVQEFLRSREAEPISGEATPETPTPKSFVEEAPAPESFRPDQESPNVRESEPAQQGRETEPVRPVVNEPQATTAQQDGAARGESPETANENRAAGSVEQGQQKAVATPKSDGRIVDITPQVGPAWSQRIYPTVQENGVWREDPNTVHVIRAAEKELVDRGLISQEQIPALRRAAPEEGPLHGQKYAEALQDFLTSKKQLAGLPTGIEPSGSAKPSLLQQNQEQTPQVLSTSDSQKPPESPHTAPAAASTSDIQPASPSQQAVVPSAKPSAAEQQSQASADDSSGGHYYVTGIDGKRVANLVGPFPSKEEADVFAHGERRKEVVDAAQQVDPSAAFWGYGVSKVTTTHGQPPFEGKLNQKVGYTPASNEGLAQRTAGALTNPQSEPVESKVLDTLRAERENDSPQSLARIPEGSGIGISKLQQAVPDLTAQHLQDMEKAGQIRIMRGDDGIVNPSGGIPLSDGRNAVRVSLTPHTLQASAAPVNRPNPFVEKAKAARARYESLVGETASDKSMRESFPLGPGVGRKGGIDASVKRAAAAVEAEREMRILEAKAKAYDDGEINWQGRSVSTGKLREIAKAKAEQAKAARLDGERGGATIGQLTLGLDKFVEHDVAPTVVEAARTIRDTGDDILKVLAPAARGKDAQSAALIMRKRLAELARRTDQVQASLAQVKKFFDSRTPEDNYAFINAMEAGQKQPTPELQAIADTFRKMMDQRRDEVQQLGKGKLENYYTNYFPHIWEDPKKAKQTFTSFFTRRPLEGPKSFLKQRTHITFQDGLDAGLKPVSDNPVDLITLKAREMDRFVMAHQVLKDWRTQGLTHYIDARNGQAPAGWMKIDDPIGTVYGQSVQQIAEFPNQGLYEGLQATAQALGIPHKRGFKLGGPALGYADPLTNSIRTRHGTAEDVLAHEIGHQIDWLAGSGKHFMDYPNAADTQRLKDARKVLRDSSSSKEQRSAARKDIASLAHVVQARKTMAKELRALSDLRNAPEAYRRSREEKMAALAHAWVGAREEFQRVAPTLFNEWKKFLDANPKLHALRDIKGSMNHVGLQQPYDVGGIVIRGNWWAPEGAARILNNYLAPGLRAKSGLYRAVLGLNNVMNQAQLGLSAFHLGFTSADAAVSKAALGFEALMRGKPVTAAKAFAGVATAPFTNAIAGDKLLKEWMKPGSQGGDIGAIVDGLVEAGGRAHMDEFYQTHMADAMKQAWRKGNWFGAVLRAPFAGVEKISDVIMAHIVPRQKLGVFADLARFEMERLGPGAKAEDVQAALAKVWDSVENRMGQMTYDNLFWDRTAKDLAMIAVRSVGWNLGTIREIGGGAVDAIKLPLQMAGGKGKDVNIHRMAYLAGLVTVSAIMGALYQYLATGQGPQELKDYFFPRNGELDESGRPQRVSMPTYVKDVYHYATEPGKTLAGKVAPIWSTFGEMIHNKDFFGTEIRNADDPLIQQMTDELKHLGKNFIPFGIRNMQKQQQLGESKAKSLQAEVGITPAPASINKTKAELLASELSNAARPVGTRTKEEAARRDAANTISRLARSGKPFADQARQALTEGTITKQDLRNALLRAHQKPLTAQFTHASLPDALKVWAVATPDERRELRPLLAKKAARIRDLPVEEQRVLAPKVRAALAHN